MRHLGAIGVLFNYFPILGYVTVENLEHGVRRRNQSALLSASSETNIYIFEKIKKGKIKVKKMVYVITMYKLEFIILHVQSMKLLRQCFRDMTRASSFYLNLKKYS